MSFLDWLDRLRKKSDGAKKRFAFLLTFALMFIVVVIWFTFSVFVPQNREKSKANVGSPFSIITNIFKELR